MMVSKKGRERMQELGRRDVYTPQVTPRQSLDGGEGSVVRWVGMTSSCPAQQQLVTYTAPIWAAWSWPWWDGQWGPRGMEVARIGQGSSRRESRGWADPPSTPTPPAVRPRWKRKLDQDRRYRACIRSTYHPWPLVGPCRPGRCWPCRHYRRGGEQQQVLAAVIRFLRRPSKVYPYLSGDGQPGGGGRASSQSPSSPLRRSTSKTEVESKVMIRKCAGCGTAAVEAPSVPCSLEHTPAENNSSVPVLRFQALANDGTAPVSHLVPSVLTVASFQFLLTVDMACPAET
jgi:hypothetical protein